MSVESIDSMPGSGTVWRLSSGAALLSAGIGLLSLLPFWSAISAMWDVWLESSEYSHGVLIPPVAAFLVWQQKDRLELMRFEGSWWGAALVALGAVLLVLGELGTIYVLVQFAFVVTLFGLTLAFMGPKPFRLIAAPMLILFLMIPLPQFAIANISANLQLVSSQIGVWLISLSGISVYAEGNIIDLGGYKLQVAEACSGLRYLFPLVTLGFLMVCFYKGSVWKRVVLFLSSIPIAILMNSIRVGTIGIMVEHWGIGMAEGFLHEFQGWMVFMLSAAVMIGEIAALNRIGHERGAWRQLFGIEFPAATPRNAPQRPRHVQAPFVAACALLGATSIATLAAPRPAEISPARLSFADFPARLGAWSGRREALDGVYLDVLKLDDYLLANYAGGGEVGVNLYLAYYNSQRKGDAVHSPRSCLPGGGWELRDFEQRTVDSVRISGRPLRVNRTLIVLGDQRQLVYYWFQQRGRIITNELAVKWYLFWDALTRNRTDGALVRLVTPIPTGGGEAAADQRLRRFAGELAPVLRRFVPD